MTTKTTTRMTRMTTNHRKSIRVNFSMRLLLLLRHYCNPHHPHCPHLGITAVDPVQINARPWGNHPRQWPVSFCVPIVVVNLYNGEDVVLPVNNGIPYKNMRYLGVVAPRPVAFLAVLVVAAVAVALGDGWVNLSLVVVVTTAPNPGSME